MQSAKEAETSSYCRSVLLPQGLITGGSYYWRVMSPEGHVTGGSVTGGSYNWEKGKTLQIVAFKTDSRKIKSLFVKLK